jgi:tetratricopeptide (TPR) repeat protein
VSRVRLPFVGRDRALDNLVTASVTASEGTGRVVALSGHSGIGKTRLIEEFSTRVRRQDGRQRDLVFVSVTCSQWIDPLNPIRPFSSLLGKLFLEDQATKKLTRVTRAVIKETAPDWLNAVPVFGSLLSAGARTATVVTRELSSPHELPADQAARFMLQYENAIKRLGAGELFLVMVIEDAQWLAATAYELLSLMASIVEQSRILLIVTFDEAQIADERPLAQLLSRIELRSNLDRLVLGPLTESNIEAAVTALYGSSLHPLLGEWMKEFSGGSPLVVEHYLSYLQDQGELLPGEVSHRAMLAPETAKRLNDIALTKPKIDLPAALEHMLELQVAKLSPDEQQLLLRASVQGQIFDVSWLAGTSDLAGIDVDFGLERLERAKFIYRTSQMDFFGNESGTFYSFADGLTHSYCYQAIPLHQRRLEHRRIASLLIGSGDGAQEFRVLRSIGMHLIAADDTDKGVEYLFDAAVRAYEGGYFLDGLAMVRSILVERPDNPDRRRLVECLLLDLSASELWWGTFLAPAEQIERIFARVGDLSAELADQSLIAQVKLMLGRYMRSRGRQVEAREALVEGLAAAELTDDLGLQFEILTVLGYAVNPISLKDGAVYLDRAVSIYNQISPEAARSALASTFWRLQSYIGIAEFDRGMFDASRDRLIMVCQHLRELRLTDDLYRAQCVLAQIYIATGAFADANSVLESIVADDASQANVRVPLVGYAHALLGKCALEAGDNGRAREELEMAYAITAASGDNDLGLSTHLYLGELLIRDNALSGAEAELVRVVRDARQANYPGIVASAESLLSAVCLLQGRLKEALALGERATGALPPDRLLVLARNEELLYRFAVVLRAAGMDERAVGLIRLAKEHIMRKASSIGNARDADRFLHLVPVNTAVLADAERLGF